MQNLNLNNYGVQELNSVEMITVDGGYAPVGQGEPTPEPTIPTQQTILKSIKEPFICW